MSDQKGLCRAAFQETLRVNRVGFYFCVIALCTLFLSVSNFIFSFMLQQCIDAALQNRMGVFFLAGGIFLLASILYGVCFFFGSQCRETLRQETAVQLKAGLLEHYLHLPVREAAEMKQGEVMTIVSQDADRIAGFVCDIAIPFVQLVVTVAVGAIYVALYSWQMFLLAAVCSAGYYFANTFLTKRMQASFSELQTQTERQKDFWVDWYENAMAIKIFSMNAALHAMYEKLFAQKKEAAVRHAKNKAQSRSFSEGMILSIEFLVLLLGVFLVRTASLTVGALVGVWNASIGTFVYPLLDIPDLMAQFAETKASYQRICTFAGRPEEETEQGEKEEEFACSQLTAQGLSFAYEKEHRILEDVSFSLKKGELVVIQGESGSGKTTLIRLLLQMLSPQEGELFLQDDATGKRSRSLRSHIAYVPQGNSLLPETLLENLSMGTRSQAKEQEKLILVLCKALGLKEKITALPKGLETVVGEDSGFSEEQAQRLALIRAIVRGRDFLLLDEPFSALDEQNVEAVVRLLNHLREEKGILVVTHREAPGLLVTRKLRLERGKLYE